MNINFIPLGLIDNQHMDYLITRTDYLKYVKDSHSSNATPVSLQDEIFEFELNG